jgi:hypothetical protein
MRHTGIRTEAALVLLALGASCSDVDDADPAAEAGSEPPTTLATAASAGDVDDDAPTTSQARAEPPMTPAAAPVEFTACVNPGPEVERGTEELSQVSLPDGEMTITRGRGYTWQSTVRDVSDPRLDGTWYNTFEGDEYTRPGSESGGTFGPTTVTHRIENNDGAWQGSLLAIQFADGETLHGPLAMIGEGAYDGLTAVGIIRFGDVCPNTRGYIIEGSVPAPRVPQTGQ